MQKSYNTSMTNQQHVLILYLILYNYQHVSSTSSIYITPHISKSSTYLNITLTVLSALHIFVTSVYSVDIWQIKFHSHYRELYVQNCRFTKLWSGDHRSKMTVTYETICFVKLIIDNFWCRNMCIVSTQIGCAMLSAADFLGFTKLFVSSPSHPLISAIICNRGKCYYW